jgi:hypothetical protein
MSFDFEKTLQGKRELRRQLAGRPLAEKLAMLDALRERALALRGANPASADSGVVREDPADYRPPHRGQRGR